MKTFETAIHPFPALQPLAARHGRVLNDQRRAVDQGSRQSWSRDIDKDVKEASGRKVVGGITNTGTGGVGDHFAIAGRLSGGRRAGGVPNKSKTKATDPAAGDGAGGPRTRLVFQESNFRRDRSKARSAEIHSISYFRSYHSAGPGTLEGWPTWFLENPDDDPNFPATSTA